MSANETDVTGLLRRWSDGDSRAVERVLPQVYGELRRIAAAYTRRERRGHTLRPTALVHEVYLQLFEPIQTSDLRFDSRAHFFAIASRVMRRLLVDYSRERRAWKRGGRAELRSLDGEIEIAIARAPDLVALDDALDSLATLDPEAARVVELRYFGGLTLEEAADCLAVSRKTVVRRWRRARAWLRAELRERDGR